MTKLCVKGLEQPKKKNPTQICGERTDQPLAKHGLMLVDLVKIYNCRYTKAVYTASSKVANFKVANHAVWAGNAGNVPSHGMLLDIS